MFKTFVCSHCDKPIERKPYQIQNSKNLYCSKKCHYAHVKGHWTGENNPQWKGGMILSVCKYCGKQYRARRDHKEQERSKYCSRQCHNEVRKKRTTFSCKQCEKHFERTPAEIRQGKTKFCSFACMGKWNSIHLSGANSPHWKGGVKGRPSANPNRQSEYYHERRAREAACEINDFTKEQWLEVLETFNHHCAYCLKPLRRADREHMIPITRGGNNTQSNIVPACRRCNVRKNDRTLLEFVASESYPIRGTGGEYEALSRF